MAGCPSLRSSPFSVVPLAAAAAPSAELWERWTRTTGRTAHGRSLSLGRLSGASCAARRGRHRAPRLRIGRRCRQGCAARLSGGAGRPRTSRDAQPAEQQAYWINLYNALTVQVILDHYPVDSIRDIDISPGFFADGPWGKKLLVVDGEEVSLDDIEHRILRPIWQDLRIHYAVNCASIGCPNLQPEAFTAENADRLMDEGARAYIGHPRGASVDRGKLTVSSIYKWFKADFGGSDVGVIDHLQQFAEPELKAALAGGPADRQGPLRLVA